MSCNVRLFYLAHWEMSPNILMQTLSPQKLRQFKLHLQENLLRGCEMCGIFSLFSEAVGSSHVWPGTASVSCDFRTVLPTWSCRLQFVPVLSGGWFYLCAFGQIGTACFATWGLFRAKAVTSWC